ncbi:MAG: high-potential iron-sulfur protein [Saprospiraceae bacterium]|nr:high-potential iron-sulfur protein [Saprospiraceae bacterium]
MSATLSWLGIFSTCVPKSNSTQENTNQTFSGDPCEDFSGISEPEFKVREAFGYVKDSPIAESQCKNCNLWKPPAEGLSCGGCTLFKGPVYDQAYCTYWAPIV